MPLFRWKKRKQQEEQAPLAAPAPQEEAPATEAVAPEGAAPAKPKRRRGSRGGRGRSKRPVEEKTETTAKAPAERVEKPKPKKPDRPERKQTRSTRASSRRRVPARRPPLPPAKRELVVSVDVGEQRVAVLEDGVVAEVYLERPEKRSIAGNIYLGTVDNVLPGM